MCFPSLCRLFIFSSIYYFKSYNVSSISVKRPIICDIDSGSASTDNISIRCGTFPFANGALLAMVGKLSFYSSCDYAAVWNNAKHSASCPSFSFCSTSSSSIIASTLISFHFFFDAAICVCKCVPERALKIARRRLSPPRTARPNVGLHASNSRAGSA